MAIDPQGAPQPPRKRNPTTGILVAVVVVLLVAIAGVAFAAGIIPNPFSRADQPVVTSSPSPSETVEVTPTPSSPPSNVPADPSTWVVDFGEVAGLRVGESLSGLGAAAGLTPVTDTVDCPSGYTNGGGFDDMAGVRISLLQLDSRGTAVADPVLTHAYFWMRSIPESVVAGSPSTSEGIRLGSSEAELLAAYPTIQKTVSKYDDTMGFTSYLVGPSSDGRYLVFQAAAAASGNRVVVSMQSSTLPAVVDVCD